MRYLGRQMLKLENRTMAKKTAKRNITVPEIRIGPMFPLSKSGDEPSEIWIVSVTMPNTTEGYAKSMGKDEALKTASHWKYWMPRAKLVLDKYK